MEDYGKKKKKKSIAEQIQDSVTQASKQYQSSSTSSSDSMDWKGLSNAIDAGRVRKTALKVEKEILEKMGLEQSNNSIVKRALEKHLPKGASITSEDNKDLAKKLVDKRLLASANNVNPDEVTDDRSALGKFLNLPKNQAWYWDALEILGRPAKGIVGAVKAQDDKDEILEKMDSELYWGLQNRIVDPKHGTRKMTVNEQVAFNEKVKADAKRLQAYRSKEAELDKTQKGSWQGFIDSVAGRNKTSAIDIFAKQRGREGKASTSDIIDGIMFEAVLDPINVIPGAILSKGITGTGKGVKKVADVTGISKIADTAPVRKVRDAFDETFGSGGRTRDLEGNIIKGEDSILEKSLDARAFQDSTLQNLEDALVASGKLAGGLDKGSDVAKVAEFPMLQKQLDEAEGVIQKGYDDAQAIQNAVKSVDGAYKGTPMDDIARVTLKDLAPEAMRKVNIVEKSPYYTRFFDDIEMTKELIKKKANMDKQLGKHYKELHKALQSANSVQKMEKAVADILSNPQMADAKEALYDVLGFYEDVKPLADNPNLTQSAKLLQEASQPIVKFAQDLGLPVKEIEGYMPRVLTEWGKEKFLDGSLGSGIKAVNSPATVNNSKVATLSDRTFEEGKTIQQINTKYKNKVFEDDAFEAFKNVDNRVQGLVTYKFIKDTFSDPRFAMPVDEAEELIGIDKLKETSVKVEIADITKHFDDDMKQAFLNSGVMQGDYYISKGLADELNKFTKVLAGKDPLKLANWWEKTTGYWKSLTVFSGVYHINNALGSAFNMYLRGMSLPEITAYVAKSTKITKDYNKAINKGFTNLTKAEQKAVDITKRFRESGLAKSSHHSQTAFKQDDFMEQVAKRVEGKKSKNPLKWNHKLAETMDDITRMAYHNWLLDSGKNAQEARSLVRETLYDVRDLTNAEQKINANAVMFYSWMRKNIPFMIKQMGENPKKFYNIGKAQNLSLEGAGQDKDLLPDYYRGAFGLPDGKMFAPNLPMQDLAKISDGESAIGTLASMSHPLAKFVFERAMDREFFNKQPITNNLEHALSTLFTPVNRLFDGIKKSKEEGKSPLDILLSLTGNPIKEYDAEKFTKYQMQDDLNKLDDEIKAKVPEEKRLTLDDLSSLGLVSKNQKSEEQLHASKKLMQDAVKQGIDPQIAQMLPHLKQKAMQSTQDELGDIVTILRKYNIPDELVYQVIKDYRKLPEMPK